MEVVANFLYMLGLLINAVVKLLRVLTSTVFTGKGIVQKKIIQSLRRKMQL